jgi:hypothetical protein
MGGAEGTKQGPAAGGDACAPDMKLGWLRDVARSLKRHSAATLRDMRRSRPSSKRMRRGSADGRRGTPRRRRSFARTLARISHTHPDGASRALEERWKCGLNRTALASRDGNTVNRFSGRNLPLHSGPYASVPPVKTKYRAVLQSPDMGNRPTCGCADAIRVSNVRASGPERPGSQPPRFAHAVGEDRAPPSAAREPRRV